MVGAISTVLDYAGGGPVEIGSLLSALACSMVLRGEDDAQLRTA